MATIDMGRKEIVPCRPPRRSGVVVYY